MVQLIFHDILKFAFGAYKVIFVVTKLTKIMAKIKPKLTLQLEH